MKIEIKPHSEGNELYNALFVDEELFDWGIDKKELQQAKKIIGDNPLLKKSIVADIRTHFVESFSEFIGKPITISEINTAIRTGEI